MPTPVAHSSCKVMCFKVTHLSDNFFQFLEPYHKYVINSDGLSLFLPIHFYFLPFMSAGVCTGGTFKPYL